MRWLTSQPDSVLSSVDAILELDQIDYTFGTKFVIDNYPANYVKWDMTTAAERIALSVADELQFAFDSRFGTDTDSWKELNVLKTMKLIVAQFSSRFQVGIPLCRSLKRQLFSCLVV
jgi:hypothetical protein